MTNQLALHFFLDLDKAVKLHHERFDTLHTDFKTTILNQETLAIRFKPKELSAFLELIRTSLSEYGNALQEAHRRAFRFTHSIGWVSDGELAYAHFHFNVSKYAINALNYALSYGDASVINQAILLGVAGVRSHTQKFAKRGLLLDEQLFSAFLDGIAKKDPLDYRALLKKTQTKIDGWGTYTSQKTMRIIEEKLDEFTKTFGSNEDLMVAHFLKDKKWAWFKEPDFDFVGDKKKWYRLFDRCVNRKSDPTHWLKEVTELTKQIDPSVFDSFLSSLYFVVAKDSLAWFRRGQNDFLMPLFIVCGILDTEKSIRFVQKLTDLAYIRIPGMGSASSSLGDVGLDVLREKPTVEKVAMLYNMKTRTKNPYFIGALERTIDTLKTYFVFDEDAVQDKYIDAYGFENGNLDMEFGDYKATITLKGYKDLNVNWVKISDNKPLKSEPSALKKTHVEDLKDFKLLLKSIKKTQSTERIRLEKSWLNTRSWDWETWENCLRQHPIVSELVSKLIWQFEENGQILTGIPLEKNKILTAEKQVLQLGNPTVTLWHPIYSTPTDVQAWRNFMFDNEIIQPIKQAFRETYPVTEAEIRTETYSNRYLNHVLGHHKMKALVEQRWWEYASVYSYDPPSLKLPKHRIKVWFDLNSDFDYAQVGQVHFQLQGTVPTAMRMQDVPPIVFSEVMRDIDLFVSKTTIAIEENWYERVYPNAQYTNYSLQYNIQRELSNGAKVRKEILQRLVPKLKIANLCAFDGPHLTVQGKLNKYRIHIESGNSFLDDMRYLCIVATRDTTNVFLPFEGDSILSVVLSKAFLLAADDTITDSTIIRQIQK